MPGCTGSAREDVPVYRRQIDRLFGKQLEVREAEAIAASFDKMIDHLKETP